MKRTGLLLWAAVSSLLLLAGPARAGEDPKDPRIDENGRSTAVWPVSPQFDHLHMILRLDIPDMGTARLSAIQTLRLSALGRARDRIRLDCAGPVIEEVRLGRDRIPFTVQDKTLTIELPRPALPGSPFEIQISYSLDFSGSRGNGLTYSAPRKSPANDSEKFPQIHSQGEAQWNSTWFPCHDFPNERLTTEMFITVDEAYEVCSNGRLVSRRSGSDGRATWHWLQDKPHANYLVSLVVGKLAVVEVGGPDSARPGLPMPVYTFLGTEDNIRKTFATTPAMIAFFEQKFDEPYPWDKYAQVIIRDFRWGGMENTSATTLFAPAADGGDQDDLISHELGHQWFGDLVTCRSWEHLWLNEGWASMCEALWAEHKAGPENGRREYLRAIRGFIGGQRASNRGSFPQAPAMASNRYRNPDEAIMKADDVYAKGAMVLHMLRQRLGDEVFTNGTRLYLDRFKFNQAETDDFRRCMEEASGESLERFFREWVYRPGLPRLDIELDWDEPARQLRVQVTQAQTINADNPAYAFSFPLYCKFEDGTGRYVYMSVDSRQTSAVFDLPSKPSGVSTDPNATVLAASVIRKPLAMWIDDLVRGPTIIAQLDAAEKLANLDEPEAANALAIVAQDPRFDDALRRAAAKAWAAWWSRELGPAGLDIFDHVVQRLIPPDQPLFTALVMGGAR
ncbi:MAG: M1 family metallopeptidase [Phycisphaerales bacterium]|nr:M1 family metallopeptidase [Phycisphaerales bacterium]